MIKKKQNILIHILGSLIFLSLPILFSPYFNDSHSIIDILGLQNSEIDSIGFKYLHLLLIITTMCIEYSKEENLEENHKENPKENLEENTEIV